MIEYNDYVARANDKLDRIIAREGDDNGERRKPNYLRQLIEEEIKADIMRERCENSVRPEVK